jgi:hypothetical protein
MFYSDSQQVADVWRVAMRETKTRGDLLASQIALALIGAVRVVRGLWKGLTDAERYAVADDAVRALKEHGDPWKLNEDLPWPQSDDSKDDKQARETKIVRRGG